MEASPEGAAFAVVLVAAATGKVGTGMGAATTEATATKRRAVIMRIGFMAVGNSFWCFFGLVAASSCEK